MDASINLTSRYVLCQYDHADVPSCLICSSLLVDLIHLATFSYLQRQLQQYLCSRELTAGANPTIKSPRRPKIYFSVKREGFIELTELGL